MAECSFTNQVILGSSPVAVTLTSDFAPVSSKEFFDIQTTIECGFTLKCVRDITRTDIQAFDKAWHDSLIFRLQENVKFDNLL